MWNQHHSSIPVSLEYYLNKNNLSSLHQLFKSLSKIVSNLLSQRLHIDYNIVGIFLRYFLAARELHKLMACYLYTLEF